MAKDFWRAVEKMKLLMDKLKDTREFKWDEYGEAPQKGVYVLYERQGDLCRPFQHHAAPHPRAWRDSAIDRFAPGEGEKKKPTDDAPDTSEMAKRVMARQASGRDAPVSAGRAAPTEVDRAADGASAAAANEEATLLIVGKDDGLKSGGAGKATVVTSMLGGGPDGPAPCLGTASRRRR